MDSASSRLPSGMVTFVFSDVEGSTRLIKRLGARYTDLLERHRALLRMAWKAYGGEEFSTEGDGFFVAFSDTADALRACAEGQRLLRAEPWPSDGVFRVRMGVHCGLAAPHNSDYLALAVNQASRVINAAHGGQVLISAETAARAAASEDFGFFDAGCYRLRDFDEPVRLLQLTGPGLHEQFPAVRALPAEGHNLVQPPNLFVGREGDTAAVTSRLGPGRVVNIVGPGGVGKTRLATEVGVTVADQWTDGVWAVDLSTVEDDTLVADAVAAAVGAPAGGNDRWQDALDYLRARRALVVLDNAETHIELCARLVPDLLRRCREVGVLATSREPLRVTGEDIVHLSPLAVPAGDASPAEAETSPAVQLFLDRARAARAGLDLDANTVAPIIGICRRLDGLPLAIEIAAARTAVLDPPSILAGLDDMYRTLRSRDRSLPERQRTMQALLDWSYRLLSADEQTALRRLAVFGGSFTMEAATVAADVGQQPRDDVPELVWSLIDRSLLAADLAANGTRYRFLETVRQYGRRLLEDRGEAGPAVGRLATWYLDQLGPLRSADRTWIGNVSLELDNLRSLIHLLAAHDPEAAQQLAWVVGQYRDTVQEFRTGIDETSRFVSELTAATPSRVALLTTLADLHLRLGDAVAASAVLAEADELRATVGPAPWDDAGVERTAGEVARRNGDPERAAAIAETALGRPLSPRGRARMWNLLGIARYRIGDLQRAFDAFAEERAEHLKAGHEAYVATAETNLAELALRLGDASGAARHQHACLELAMALGQPVMLAYSLILAGRISAAAGDWPTAVRLQARASAMLEETGHRLYDNDLEASEELLAGGRDHLGKDFEAAFRTGVAMDTPAAAALAEEVLSLAAATASAIANLP